MFQLAQNVKDWTSNERLKFLKTIGNKKWRMEHFYKIKNKERQTVNLIFNPIQNQYWGNRTYRDYILKARKIGFSTLCLIDDLDATICNHNFTAFIMAHKREDVQKLFKIVQFAYDRMPVVWKPKAEYYNRNELYFKEINSTIYVGSEARSDVINRLHVSELAFIENVAKKMAATFEAVPENGRIVLETTPNGMGGYAYDLWQAAAGYITDEPGQCEFKGHFYAWFYHPEYTVPLASAERRLVEAGDYLNEEEEEFRKAHHLNYGQMKWRKQKQARLGDQFLEQYPEDDISCFLGSGDPYFNMKALREQLVEVEA